MHRFFHCLLLSALFFSTLGNGMGQAAGGNPLIDAMVRMMDAMGLFDPDAWASAALSARSGTPPPPVWRPNGGSVPTMPADPSAAMQQGSRAAQSLSDALQSGSLLDPGRYFQPVPLEGIWEGRNGELLIVQGDRFRIYPGTAPYVEGYLQTQNDWVILYNPKDGNRRPFEFAEFQGRLVLRDAQGNLYLYRKLWWTDPAQRLPSPSPRTGGAGLP